MGILDKNKKTTKSAFNSTSSSNLLKNGNKKASYSLNIQKEIENIDPKMKTNEILAEQNEIYHDNPAYEPESTNQEQLKNPFDPQSSKKEASNNESYLLETQNQTSNWTNILTNNSLIYIDSNDIKNFDQIKEDFYNLSFNYQGISTQASINNTEKLAAAAAAAVSSTAASLVEVPNFGQELSTMMKQNRMDEIEMGSKKEESNIIQNNGYAFGEGNSLNKNMKKSPSSNAIGDLDDDAKLKLTGTSASYDIKIRQRRACHLKLLVILVAMLTAGFIGCVFTYYFMRYQMENQKYLSYTQNMVLERACSNKLEIVVPFTTNVTDINDKNILVNKIEEIVHQTFMKMNKTVDLMQLYELNEVATNSYVATIDVELKDASDFSNVILRKESENRIKIDETSDIIKNYRNNFLNVTLGLNILPEILTINVSNVEILYDFKMIHSTLNQTVPTTVSKINEAFTKEKFLSNRVDFEITKNNRPKLLSSIISSSPSVISESTIYFTPKTLSSSKLESISFTTAPLFSSSSKEIFKAELTSAPATIVQSTEINTPLITKGLSRILSTTASLTPQVLNSIEPSFSPKIKESTEFIYDDIIDKGSLKLLKNSQTTNLVLNSADSGYKFSTASTDIPPNKILIAEILLNNEQENDLSSKNKNTNEKVKNKSANFINIKNIESQLSTDIPNDSNQNNGLDILLQINGGDSSLLNRLIGKNNHL